MQKTDWVMITGCNLNSIHFFSNSGIEDSLFNPLMYCAIGTAVGRALGLGEILSDGLPFVYKNDKDEQFRLFENNGLLRIESVSANRCLSVADLTFIRDPFGIQFLAADVRMAILEANSKNISELEHISMTYPLVKVTYVKSGEQGELGYFFKRQDSSSIAGKYHCSFFNVTDV
jgi:hypothetical protein